MKYNKIKKGIFLKRPNRFIAHVMVDGKEEICHVKNTGRCRELLIEGVTQVYLSDGGNNPKRKTRYSVIGVNKNGQLINMDSQAPNEVVDEYLQSGGFIEDISYMKREKTYGDSRIDFYFEYKEKKCFMEVKGVTLFEGRTAMFPDAKTSRGVKHIYELIKALEEGYETYIFFVIQGEEIDVFTPAKERDPAFYFALEEADKKGVNIICMNCIVTEDSLNIKERIPYIL